MSPDEHVDDLGVDADMAVVLASLAELTTEQPPQSLRPAILEVVRQRPRHGVDPLASHEVYLRRAASLSDLLDDLDPGDWAATVDPYRWCVHRLLAHLTVIEEYTARQFGLSHQPPHAVDDPATADHLGMGGAAIAHMVAGDPETTAERWRTAFGLLHEHVRSERFDSQRSTPMHGWPFNAETAMIVRSFELWTHTEDICRATGRPLEPPEAAELKAMSTASVSALPILTDHRIDAPSPTRIVLTGPGGGTYDLWGPEPHRNLMVIDVVDYCRVVADRVEPASVIKAQEGDHDLLAELLSASQAIAL